MNANDTLDQIQRLANERHNLYRRASDLSQRDRDRIGEITNRLAVLWDQYRRELAAENRGNTPPVWRQDVA